MRIKSPPFHMTTEKVASISHQQGMMSGICRMPLCNRGQTRPVHQGWESEFKISSHVYMQQWPERPTACPGLAPKGLIASDICNSGQSGQSGQHVWVLNQKGLSQAM